MICLALLAQISCYQGAALAGPPSQHLRTPHCDVTVSNPVLHRKGCGQPAQSNMHQKGVWGHDGELQFGMHPWTKICNHILLLFPGLDAMLAFMCVCELQLQGVC
jgi:hypothetical protein